jgi:MFS transporter, MHS family, shikimate and dehydroshikimate transport protein
MAELQTARVAAPQYLLGHSADEEHSARAPQPLGGETTDSPAMSIGKVAVASLVGTIIEWYDFLLYGTAAALVFSRLFFPAFDPAVGTLAALATFGAGFAARPLGGAIFGHFGDTRGRKSMLVLTLLLMGTATFLIGLLPTYDQVGALAPVLLVALRLCQGIGLGGEWGAAVLLAVEHAPPRRRGFYGSWPQMGAPAGLLLASVLFLAVSSLPEQQLFTWGWRVPFLLSLVLVLVGLLVRRTVDESPAFARLKAARGQAKQPLLEVLRRHPRPVLLAMGARCAEIGLATVFNTFVLSYATQALGLPRPSVLTALLIGTVVALVVIPAAGALSDRLGRRPVYLLGALAATLLVMPACLLIDTGQVELLTIGIIVGLLGPAVMMGPQASFFAELFGTRVRYTGASLGFQLGAVLAGGLSPVIAASTVAAAGNLLPVGWFMVGLGIITLACVWAAAETRPRAMGDERVGQIPPAGYVVEDGRLGTRAPGP